ncbi:MAG: Acetolactate synthase isozyme 3 large subunit [Phycisphaerae bacterium]|nr:Acetolactate synthase isozyme 3 large subunit [Phycisphaerae bacterium]
MNPDPTASIESSSSATLTGAQLFHRALLNQGVEVMFGYPGGAALPLFDVLHDSPIRFVLVRHEQGAAHMADGYARASGRPGVVLVTSGPGATNLVTGLATAHFDSVPVVAFTGQVKSHLIGNDAFQEADVTGITRPVTKHNALCRDASAVARMVNEAFFVATTGRPGPVLVDLPVDLMNQPVTPGPGHERPRLRGYKPRRHAHQGQIAKAAAAINAAERPVLYVGGGVIISGASELVRQLAERGNIPVTTTLLGLGAVDETSPLALRMLGMHGTAYANYAVQESDCLVAIGARFDDRVTGDVTKFAPKAAIIHIDIDPASISKSVNVDLPVVGDARDALEHMLPLIERRPRQAWFARIEQWKRQHPLKYGHGEAIKPQAVIEQLGRLTDHDALITTGVGQHQMWAAQFYGWRRPRQMITSGGLGTMGFGLPAAIGAQFACPGRLVVDIDGDSSFQMTMSELATAVACDLPVKVVLLNNNFQGMVRQWQQLFYDRRYSASRMVNPNFAALADAFGATGLRIDRPDQVGDGLNELLTTEGPAVLEVLVDAEENVYPMVPSGHGLDEMDLGSLA